MKSIPHKNMKFVYKNMINYIDMDYLSQNIAVNHLKIALVSILIDSKPGFIFMRTKTLQKISDNQFIPNNYFKNIHGVCNNSLILKTTS